MIDSKPTSFVIFIIAIAMTGLIFLTAAYIPIEYSAVLALMLVFVFLFVGIGIYAGSKFKSDEKRIKLYNSIGIAGNTIIFLFIMGIMIYAAFV